jgi:hypothetical protein
MEKARVHDHALTAEEIANRLNEAMLFEMSDSPERRARASMGLSGYELEETMAIDQPPEMFVTGDNWLLTPMTDAQFAWIVKAIRCERKDKAQRIEETIADVPALKDALGSEKILPEQVPVLNWASPKEFERVVEYGERTKKALDKATLVSDTLLGLAVAELGEEKVVQAVQDTLDLSERLKDIPDPSPKKRNLPKQR